MVQEFQERGQFVRFLKIIVLAATAQKLTGKRLGDIGWEDLLTIFSDEKWVELFEEVVELF